MRAHPAATVIPFISARFAALALVCGLGLSACTSGSETTSPGAGAEATPAEPVDAWAVHEALEQQIAGPGASESERKAALEQVRLAADDNSAGYAYARASVAGRLAETRGLKALKLLEEMRDWCEESIARDATFEGMAATRMLGTLHALAGQHFDGGDSEYGLELLESVVDAHADVPRNHLRLAEGYVALGDPESAFEGLCTAVAGRSELEAAEAVLLDGLLEEIGGADLLPCDSAEAAP